MLRSVLSSSFIDQKTLQRLCGKCNSLSLVVPGARMFTNEINLAISKAARSSRPISLVGPLRAEIESWAFLENWQGSLPWRSEFHHQLVLFSDASSSGWGGLLNPGALSVSIRDYWQHTHSTLDINSKEILALANVLDSFSSTISNSWVDAFTDSQVLLQSWSRQGAKSPNVIAALKQLYAVVSRSNIHLSLHHIPSRFNLADTPSRPLSLLDSMLSSDTWTQVQGHFGGPSGHYVDLMALPSNVQHASSGHPLPFFSPVPSPGASGVNVFSQRPHHHPFFSQSICFSSNHSYTEIVAFSFPPWYYLYAGCS